MSSVREEHYEIAANYIRYLVEGLDVFALEEYVDDALGEAGDKDDPGIIRDIMGDMVYHLT